MGSSATGELTLSLPRKPRTDFGAETGHPAEADTSPEQVRIGISPSERRHGDGNGDPVEGHIWCVWTPKWGFLFLSGPVNDTPTY